MEYNIIWFVLLIVLFVGFIVLDGFDMGVGMIHNIAKTDHERRIMINSIGPLWDGNEVWLITAGGALFAAFPDVYATVFSGFYTAFMLFLAVLIGRASAIEFRSKTESKAWRSIWDGVFNISSYLIALLLGVSLGNIISGFPVRADMEFGGTFFGLLHPYAIFLGLTAVVTLRMHGRLYSVMKTEDELYERLRKGLLRSWLIFAIFYVIVHVWTIAAYPRIAQNMLDNPIWFVVPLLAIVSIIAIPTASKVRKHFLAFLASSVLIAMSIAMVGIGIYPNLVISNPVPENSLTIFNASSSLQTLKTMFIIACIGVPLVLIYTVVVYRTFKGKVKIDSSSY